MDELYKNVQLRSERVKRRRSIVFLVISALIPGSVQIFCGKKKLGWLALRIWGVLLILFVLLGLGVVFFRGSVFGLLLRPWLLTVVKIFLWLLVIGWISLIFNSWLLSNPVGLNRENRIITGSLALVISCGLFFGGYAMAGWVNGARNVAEIFKGGGDSATKDGRINVLLLGADAPPGPNGIRTDSMTLASIDAKTGRTVLFGLPRNLERAPFPKDSPLHKLYPNGYWCKKHECLLNAIHSLAEDHKSMFPDSAEPGVEALKGVISEILGLDINYYALVDMNGFKDLVDAIGGIRLNIRSRIGIGDSRKTAGEYIAPGNNVLLDGYHSLWFARSRFQTNDYDRMARQKCVMAAMVKQLNPTTVATKFEQITAASKGAVSTDISPSQISGLVDLAFKGKKLPITSVSFVPPRISPADPDFDLIRKVVKEEIAKSEAKDNGSKVIPTPDTSDLETQDTSKNTKNNSSHSSKTKKNKATKEKSENKQDKKVREVNLDKVCAPA